MADKFVIKDGAQIRNGTLEIGFSATTGYIFPSLDGTANQVLTTDGNGVLFFTTPATVAPGGSNTQIQYNNNGSFGGDSGFTTNGAGSVNITGDLDIDNININGNTISSTNTDGNIVIDPNGTGAVNVSSAKIINLATPIDSTDAATKGYVDTGLTYLKVTSSGVAASAIGTDSVAIGTGSTAYANEVVLGSFSNSLVRTTTDSGNGRIILGSNACVGSGTGTLSIGATGRQIIIGRDAHRAAGTDKSVTAGLGAIAIGTGACQAADGNVTTGDNSITIGRYSNRRPSAGDLSVGAMSVSIGNNINQDVNAGAQSIAIGAFADSTGTSSIAIGGSSVNASSADATADYAIAIGFNSLASANNAVAIGANIEVTSAGQLRIGTSATNFLNLSATGALTFGSAGASIQVDNINIDGNTISSTNTNGNIVIDPNGTGDIYIGNYVLDGDQTIGAGQDNYVLTYDNTTGKVSLEAIAATSPGVTVQDEGAPLATAATTLNFTGAGVTASGTGTTKTINIPGGGGGDGTSIPTIANVSSFPSAPSPNTVVYARCYSVEGDGGGGLFRWDNASTATAIPGIIIGTGTGRWIRLYDGAIDVRWCGAKNDDSTDNSSAFTAALATGKDLRIEGGGTYRFSTAQPVTGAKRVTVGADTTLDWRGAGFGIILDGWRDSQWHGGKCRYVDATASGGEVGFFLWRARAGSTVNNSMAEVHFIGTADHPATRSGRFHNKFVGNENSSTDDGWACYYNVIERCTGYGCECAVLAVPGDGAANTRQPNGNRVISCHFQYFIDRFRLGKPRTAFTGDSVGDGAMTAGSATLTSASNPWVSGDVGQTIWVDRAGAGGTTLKTTISAYGSAGSITLAAAASVTVASAQVEWNVADGGYDRNVDEWLFAHNWGSGAPAESPWTTSTAYRIRGVYNRIDETIIEHDSVAGTGLALVGMLDDTIGLRATGIFNCKIPIETPQAGAAFHESVVFEPQNASVGMSKALTAVVNTGGGSVESLDLTWVKRGSLTQTAARTVKYVRGLQVGQSVELWIGDGQTTFAHEAGSVPEGSIAMRVEGGTHVAPPAAIYTITQHQGLAHVARSYDYTAAAIRPTITSPTHGQAIVYDSVGGAWKNDTVSGSGSVADNSITNAKLADMAQSTIKGRAAGAGTGDPTDLTATQVRTLINVADGATAAGATGDAYATSHEADTTAHTAANIVNTPAGNIAATTVQAALNELDTEKATLASPTFTGTPAAPTAAADTNTTQVATTAYVVGQATSTAASGLAATAAAGTSLKYARSDHAHQRQLESIIIACGDETTAITAGNAKVTFRMPYAFTLTAVRASLTTAQASGNIFRVDINEGGTSILSTLITIDNTEKTSTTAAAAAVISDTALADDAEIVIDVDQIGDGTAKGLKVTLIGRQSA